MSRVEFRLSMPGRASWNGKWSGEDKNYTITKSFKDAEALKFDGKSWSYNWPDGWYARVDARVIHPGAKTKKSDGFNGYDWMVDSILQYGKIYADHQRPDAKAVTP